MTMANLYYIIGGSGSGKDSLIGYLKAHIPKTVSVEFARRYITRAADAGGEIHIELTKEQFKQSKKDNRFAMDWYSHDTYYGIGTEIDTWLANGINVVMNGSRGYLDEASKRYPDIIPVLISVDPVILSDRLFARGRENYKQIEKRIAQAIKLDAKTSHPNIVVVENNSQLSIAGEKLLTIIVSRYSNKCA
jgi:ribose 1,5-bisphosphokinase